VHLAEIWRYPVKSMAGEMIPEAVLGRLGLPGDRALYVIDRRGEVVSARTRPRLLQLKASLEHGETTVDGLRWDDPEVARRVTDAAGDGARLVRAEAGERFDILPLLVVTDGAVAALGTDRRRLRPNLVIGGVPGQLERGWEGRFLRIGEATIGLADLRQRCIMTTWDPDTGEQDVNVLRRIHDQLEGKIALNAWPVVGGRIQVGDPVEVVDRVETVSPPVLGRLVRQGR
jgi:uncharacterized protein YcbX